MDRFGFRMARPLALLAALTLPACTAGCTNVLATAVWLIKGTNVPAEYNGLKDKKVAVVCRQVTSQQYNDPNVARDLGEAVGQLLAENVSKIDVIDQQKVSDWTDENDWDDYKEIGRALGADMVLAVDIESFKLQESQTLYQGQANVSIKVYDLKNNGKVAFSKPMPPSVYPPNTGIPASDKQHQEFRRQYMQVLAGEIARHFYAHDSHVNFALDSTAF